MADLFGNIASGIGNLFGSGDTSLIAGLGNIAGGAYDLYQGYQGQQQQSQYLDSLYASQGLSDTLLREQADRAENLYFPIEDLQAQYALEDLEAGRPLSEQQRQYTLDRGAADISFAQNVIDPTRDDLLTFLSQGKDAGQFMDIASTDVNQAFDQANQALLRQKAQQGINPNSGAYQNVLNQNAVSRAAALAGSRTEAGRLAEDLDIQRKGQAINYAAGIPFSAAQAPQSGTALSQQAAQGFQSAATGLAKGAELAGAQAQQGFSGASASFGNAANYLQPTQQNTSVQQNPYGYTGI